MGAKRENTLVVDFSVLPKHLEFSVIHKFICEELKLDIEHVTNIQFHNVKNCVYVEMIDMDTAKRYQNAHHLQHIVKCGESVYKVPVYVEDGAINIRVHDLPPKTPSAVIAEHLRQFGTIISISRERWKHYFPGLLNGVRVVRMQLSQPIPSYVTIDGDTTLITYQNQPKTKKAHPHNNNNVAPQASANNLATTALFTATDFPPLDTPQPTRVQNQNNVVHLKHSARDEKKKTHLQPERDDGDQSSNNSEAETTDSELAETHTAHKRRLSADRKENTPKRKIKNQCYQNEESHESLDEIEEILDDSVVNLPMVTRSKASNRKK